MRPTNPLPAISRRAFLVTFGKCAAAAAAGVAATAIPSCLDDRRPSGDLFPTKDFGIPPADPVLPGAPAMSAYALVDGEVQPFGTLQLPNSQFLAGFAVRLTDGRLVATSTSVGDTIPHVIAGGTVTPDGVVFDATQEVAQRLGIPHLDAVQDGSIVGATTLRTVVPWHNVEASTWGWNLWHVLPDALYEFGTHEEIGNHVIGGTLDAATSQISGMVLYGGLLALTASNLVGPDTFAPGTLHILPPHEWLALNPVSYPDGTFDTGGLNPNGLREVVIDGASYLMVVNSGPIDTDGNSLGKGSILLFPSQEAGTQQTVIDAPGGLALSGQVSLIDTEDGPIAALPSAANDGKTYLVNLRTLRNTGSFEQSATAVTVPTIAGGKNLVAFAEFSPDGRYIALANQNTGRLHVYDLLAGQLTTAGGYLLDSEPHNHQEIAPTAAWLEGVGLLVGVGQEFKRVPLLQTY